MSTIDPVTRRLRIYKEVDFVDDAQWLIDGVPADLSGYTLEGAMRAAYATPDVEAVSFAFQTLNAAQGYFRKSLTEAQTAGITWDSGVYDVRATKDGVTQQLERGTVRVFPSAT